MVTVVAAVVVVPAFVVGCRWMSVWRLPCAGAAPVCYSPAPMLETGGFRSPGTPTRCPFLPFGVVEWSSVRRSVHGATSDSHGTAPSRRPRSYCTPRMGSGGRGWSRRRQLLVVARRGEPAFRASPPKTRCSLVLVGVPLLSACGSRHFAPPEGRHHPRVKGASMMAQDTTN